MTPSTQDARATGLVELAERVAEANYGEEHKRLNEEVALALGWKMRKVTGLGVNGRTPGRWLWFAPFATKGSAKPPQLLNTRRAQTIAALRALAASTKDMNHDG